VRKEAGNLNLISSESVEYHTVPHDYASKIQTQRRLGRNRQGKYYGCIQTKNIEPNFLETIYLVNTTTFPIPAKFKQNVLNFVTIPIFLKDLIYDLNVFVWIKNDKGQGKQVNNEIVGIINSMNKDDYKQKLKLIEDNINTVVISESPEGVKLDNTLLLEDNTFVQKTIDSHVQTNLDELNNTINLMTEEEKLNYFKENNVNSETELFNIKKATFNMEINTLIEKDMDAHLWVKRHFHKEIKIDQSKEVIDLFKYMQSLQTHILKKLKNNEIKVCPNFEIADYIKHKVNEIFSKHLKTKTNTQIEKPDNNLTITDQQISINDIVLTTLIKCTCGKNVFNNGLDKCNLCKNVLDKDFNKQINLEIFKNTLTRLNINTHFMSPKFVKQNYEVESNLGSMRSLSDLVNFCKNLQMHINDNRILYYKISENEDFDKIKDKYFRNILYIMLIIHHKLYY